MADADVVIVGGGPAGMMAGLLLARAGVSVLVLEKHGEFLRDFRGDTVHPSTMELLGELGMLERFLQRPHDRVDQLGGRIAGQEIVLADLRHLPVPAPFIAMMPQWEFLDFLRVEASAFPSFRLEQNAGVASFIETDGRITGVTLGDGRQFTARLVIAADGRKSLVRVNAMLPVTILGAPMDIFWFRVPKVAVGDNRSAAVFEAGRLFVLIDRGDYWQCAFVFPKGGEAEVKARGLPALLAVMEDTAPELGPLAGVLTEWDQFSLLSVALDRLDRWHRPGLLAIGDAAHAMSPIGGVGINLAVQDAVAAANILAGGLAAGHPVDHLLAKVERRRLFPTRVIQRMQALVQRNIIGKLLDPSAKLDKPPFVMRLFGRFPYLQRIPAHIMGLGIRREHIRSPIA